jgi:hypothetical protein
MPEQLSSFEQQREALAEKLRLREQYEQQIKTLNETGVLEILPESQELGIIGIDGKGYPIPTYEQILQRITPEKVELLTKKFEQGFTQLLIVPFAMSLTTLIDRHRREILRHHQEGTLLSIDGQKLELDEKDPLYYLKDLYNADISGELVYQPKEFSQDHQGKTKTELLQEKGAWQIIFVEDLPNLPAKGKGQTIQGRHQIEAGKNPFDYLKLVKKDLQYPGEQGFSPETWLTLAITTLHQKNQVIDDVGGQGKTSYLIASCFRDLGNVIAANWNRNYRQACLAEDYVMLEDPSISTRTRVEI